MKFSYVMANNDYFRAKFAKRIDKAKSKQELFIRKLALEIDSRIILKSPVSSGRFRGNWNVSLSEIDTSISETLDVSGGKTIAEHTELINSIKIDGKLIYITNSLPYAHRLEYEGWSKQAPAGFVRITVAELSGIINQIGAEVKAL